MLKSLAGKFGVPWDSIATATMGSSDPNDINSWLENNGGKKLPSGYWAFDAGQEITIPPPADQPEPDLDIMLASLSDLTGDALA